ncbi:MAG: methyltransferase domain-containing protein [Candidatus Aquicultor sp.]|nr:methyltransferase domain-containing protein [Candidatus Aquicultor sp.]
MGTEQGKALLKETFDSVAGAFDCEALRFFRESAEHLGASLELRGDEHVLDVATGTGHAALSIARSLPQGQVTGVDFSPGMLDQARKKAAALDMRNVVFLERDMQALGFAADYFDAALCAFGVFFAGDMDAQLSHITSAVKPGGQVAISEFQENIFYPLANLMFGRLAAYGVKQRLYDWKRIATEKECKRLFEQAGLENIRVDKRNMGYYLGSAEEWWDVIWNAGFRRLVDQLAPGDLERFKREHLREVNSLKTKDGIWLEVGVLFTVGTKP